MSRVAIRLRDIHAAHALDRAEQTSHGGVIGERIHAATCTRQAIQAPPEACVGVDSADGGGS